MKENEKIIKALLDKLHDFLSGQELADELGVSRTAIWKKIQNLRKLGFGIEGSSAKGYRLTAIGDAIIPDEIKKNLKTRIIGKEIIYKAVTQSTNTDAFELAKEGALEGTCIIAEVQTAGRGRLGRSWIAKPSSSILTSIIIRPQIPPSHAPILTLAAGIAVHRAIERVTSLVPHIKWPNDILVNDKKVAGILTEMNAELDIVHFVVIGIGINVNYDLRDMPDELTKIATSLNIQTGRFISRNYLITALYEEMEGAYRRFIRQGPSAIVEEWQERAHIKGRKVTATIMNGVKIMGCAQGVDDDGALLVKTGSGSIHRITAGEVIFAHSDFPS